MPAGGEVRMELSLSTRTVAGHRVLEVGGEIDVYTAPQLRERLIALVEAGDRQLIVDLAPVEVLDSTGLGGLVGALRRVRGVGGARLLARAPARVLTDLPLT